MIEKKLQEMRLIVAQLASETEQLNKKLNALLATLSEDTGTQMLSQDEGVKKLKQILNEPVSGHFTLAILGSDFESRENLVNQAVETDDFKRIMQSEFADNYIGAIQKGQEATTMFKSELLEPQVLELMDIQEFSRKDKLGRLLVDIALERRIKGKVTILSGNQYAKYLIENAALYELIDGATTINLTDQEYLVLSFKRKVDLTALNEVDPDELRNDFAMMVAQLGYFAAKYALFNNDNEIVGYRDGLGKLSEEWLSLIDAAFDQLKEETSQYRVAWFVSTEMLEYVAKNIYPGQDKEVILNQLLKHKRLGDRTNKNTKRQLKSSEGVRYKNIEESNAGLGDAKVNGHFTFMIEHAYPRLTFAHDVMRANKSGVNIAGTQAVLDRVGLVWIMESQHAILEKTGRDSESLLTLLNAYQENKSGVPITLLGIDEN